MDLTTFKATLSDVYGLDEASLADGVNLDAVINQAIKKISIYYPEIELTSLQTVVNQTRYTVADENLMKVKEVYYRSDTTSSAFGPDIKFNSPYTVGGSTFTISQKMTSDYERLNLRKLYPVGADIVSFNKFDLIPTPTEVKTVYYEYLRYRTIEEIPDMFEEDMTELVFFYMEENEYKKSRLDNSGNVFQFDRRGNNTQSSSAEMEMKSRTRIATQKNIETSIKLKVLKLG